METTHMKRYQSVFTMLLALIFFITVFAGAASGVADTQSVNQIGAESNNGSSTESLIIRFEPYGGSGDGGGVSAQTTEDSTPDVEDLKRHADNAMDPFEDRFGSAGGLSTTADSSSSGVTIKQEFWIASAALVEVDTDQVSRSELLETRGVKRVHENFEVSIADAATSKRNLAGNGVMSITPQTSRPTTFQTTTGGDNPTRAIEQINVPEVWNTYNNTGGGVRVAVVDTGVNPDHPDINISNDSDRWACYIDCSGNPDGPHDVDGHGTHVSGTIVGGGANDENLDIGVAPNATLMHAKGLGDDGSGYFSNVTNSMQWAVKNDADILSMSLGWPKGNYVGAFIEPVQNAQNAENGTIVIAASGNDGPNPYSNSPGNIYDVTAVGSVDIEPEFGTWNGVTDNDVSSFSNGEIVYDSNWSSPPSEWPESYVVPDVVAPGNPIWSADTNINTKSHSDNNFETEDLTHKGGTSMATPHVAGVAALMQAETKSELTPGEIKSALRSTANYSIVSDPDRNDEARKGEGLIDAMAAVESVQQSPFFEINITEVNNTATEGENITVNYTVENTGGLLDTQNIEFQVNGTSEATELNITLDDGETYNDAFTYTTVTGDAPAVELNVSSANDTAIENTTVQATSEDPGQVSKISQITADSPTATGTTATGNYTVELNELVQANVTLNFTGDFENLTAEADHIANTRVVTGTNVTAIDDSALMNGTAVVKTNSSGQLDLAVTFNDGVQESDVFNASIDAADPNVSTTTSNETAFSVDTTGGDDIDADSINSISTDNPTADGITATGNYTASLNNSVKANVTLSLTDGNLTSTDITAVSVINGSKETTVDNNSLVNGNAVVTTTTQGELDVAVTFASGVNTTETFNASIDTSDTNVSDDDSLNASFFVDTTAHSTTTADSIESITADSPTANGSTAIGNYTVELNESVQANVTLNFTGDQENLTAADGHITNTRVINGSNVTAVNASMLVNGAAVVKTDSNGELDLAVTFNSSVNESDVFNASIDAADPNVSATASNETAFSVDTTTASAVLTGTDLQTLAGTNATIAYELENTGDQNSSYILNLTVPDNWTPVAYSDDGGDRQDGEVKWVWQTIEPNETVTPTVTVEVPEGINGSYTVTGEALNNDNVVSQATATASVLNRNVTADIADQTVANGSETSVTVEAPLSNGTFVNVTENATFSSNNTAIATVGENGTVTGNGTGTAIINATYEGEKDSITVTVEPASIEQAIDSDNNQEIDGIEILTAINYWEQKAAVPQTDGKTIGDLKILNLIEKWRNNTQV